MPPGAGAAIAMPPCPLCGAGHLLALARSAGWEVAGVDPSAECCSRAQARYGFEVQASPLGRIALACMAGLARADREAA